jgi:hypothetical protein
VGALRLAADGDGSDGDRKKTAISSAAGSEGKDKSGGSVGPFSGVQKTWRQLNALWGGFQVPKLEEDDLPEAVALNAALQACKADPSAVPLKKLSSMTGDYYKASYDRIMARPAVKDGLPLLFSAANAGVVLLVLRLLLPRLLAIESMNDVYEFAPQLGLPSKTELLQYVEYAQNMDYATKFFIFLIIICVEKVFGPNKPAPNPLPPFQASPLSHPAVPPSAQISSSVPRRRASKLLQSSHPIPTPPPPTPPQVTLVGEFLPIGIVLPSISPVLFGGVLQGTLISAFCAAFGSSLNFVRQHLRPAAPLPGPESPEATRPRLPHHTPASRPADAGQELPLRARARARGLWPAAGEERHVVCARTPGLPLSHLPYVGASRAPTMPWLY